MTITAAFTTQGGLGHIPGIGHAGIFTITWDASSLVTGELLDDLLDYFSEIDAIIPAGVSAIELAGYVPSFSFTPSSALSTGGVLAYLTRVPALDGDAASAQPLAIADALDVASLGTTQVMVIGKAIDPRA